MRLAMVATPAALLDLRPAPGSLDGDVIRARLPLPDAGFLVVDLDPAIDLAEQIELLFEGEAGGGEVLFYASCRVILSEDGEIFLSFNPAEPDTGDSLRDIALVFRERARGPVAFVLECRHAPDPDDPFRGAAIVAAAKEAVAVAGGAIELLVAAQPVGEGESEDRTSPLTRALIEALDDPDAEHGLTLGRFVALARENPDIAASVPCFAHVRGRANFEVLPQIERPAVRQLTQPQFDRLSYPEASVETSPAANPEPAPEAEVAEDVEPFAEPEAEPERRSAPVPAPAPDAAPVRMPGPRPPHESEVVSSLIVAKEPPPPPAPEPQPPYRSEMASIPVVLDEPRPPEPRAPYRSEAFSVDLSDIEPTARAPLLPEPSSQLVGGAVLPEQRSFLKSEPAPPPRVVVSTPRPSEPAPARHTPPPEPAARSSEPPKRANAAPPKAISPADHIALGDALKGAGDAEAALTSYKRALGMLGPNAAAERAEVYVRLGQLKQSQDKRREAIANFEKALALFPALEGGGSPLPDAQRAAMEALIDLNVAEGDHRGVAGAEDRLLATLADADERFWRLLEFGGRWQDEAGDPQRARAAFERARALKPDEPAVLEKLAAIYRVSGMATEALMTGQRLAALTRDPRERAERYFTLGQQCIHELRRDELGLELFDLALESDPTMLEPLALVARVLADRQEWSQLEQAYRRMLGRVDHIPEGTVRTEVTFELCRRLGLLFRDHLEDPALGLDAFEDAVHTKPADLPMRLATAELARSLGKHDRVAIHLAEAAALDPGRVATFHELFEAFQKLRRPDQAYQAASVTMLLRQADARERFIFEEHKVEGVAKPAYAMPAEGWEWLRPHSRDVQAEAVLAAITPAAIAVRLAQLAQEGRLLSLDPALRQDPEKTTVSIVRSFAWASHFLGVPAPAIYLNDDPELSIAAVIADEPTVFAGGKVLRNRSLPELAFLVGRHLAYHVGGHRLLLYYPSIEELTACFLAAIRIVLPDVAAPVSMRAAVSELERGIALRISEANRVDLAAAVAAFEANGSRVHIADWAADVERCATRAGFLLAGDLEVATAVLRSEPRAVLDPDAKIADLLAFAVSEEHHALRESLGIAIQP